MTGEQKNGVYFIRECSRLNSGHALLLEEHPGWQNELLLRVDFPIALSQGLCAHKLITVPADLVSVTSNILLEIKGELRREFQ